MKINRKLNLVINLQDESGQPFYVYSQPIAREVFERFYLPLSRVFTEITTMNLLVMGPQVAANMLKDISRDLGMWGGDAGVQTLFDELRRLTSVVVPLEGRWQPAPLDVAVNRELLDDDDLALIEGSLVFFTAVSFIAVKQDRPALLNGAAAMWGVQTSSSDITGLLSSLPTLSVTANSGETPNTASVPV